MPSVQQLLDPRASGDDPDNPTFALLRQAILIRRVEERLLALFSEGKLNGTVHTCIGQEWVGVALAAALNDGDTVFSTAVTISRSRRSIHSAVSRSVVSARPADSPKRSRVSIRASCATRSSVARLRRPAWLKPARHHLYPWRRLCHPARPSGGRLL